MRYIAANTTIPVPHVYHYGTAAAILLAWACLSPWSTSSATRIRPGNFLDPGAPTDERLVLDPDIGEEKLEFLYSQMANTLL